MGLNRFEKYKAGLTLEEHCESLQQWHFYGDGGCKNCPAYEKYCKKDLEADECPENDDCLGRLVDYFSSFDPEEEDDVNSNRCICIILYECGVLDLRDRKPNCRHFVPSADDPYVCEHREKVDKATDRCPRICHCGKARARAHAVAVDFGAV